MAPATKTKPKKSTRAKKTPSPSGTPADRPEPCSTLSPDGAFSCDLPTGHTGILTNHTSAGADGRMWLSGTWRGPKAREAEKPACMALVGDACDPEAPCILHGCSAEGPCQCNKPTALERIDANWQLIVGETVAAAASRPIEIVNGGLLIETLAAKTSEKLSALHCSRILEEVVKIDPSINRLQFHVKGAPGESMTMIGIGEKAITATVDGQAATIVLNGSTGAPKADEPGKTEPLLPTMAQLEANIVIAWDDFQDAETEKKRATAAHKEAQDYLNALVKEQVKRTRGGKARQLALGEEADDEDQGEICEGCKKPATTEDSEGVPLCEDCHGSLRNEAIDRAANFEALPDRTLVVDEEPADPVVTSIRHHVWLATDGGAISYDDARAGVIMQLLDGDLEVAPEGSVPTIATCRACGCTEEFACDPACAWVEDGLCDSQACVSA